MMCIPGYYHLTSQREVPISQCELFSQSLDFVSDGISFILSHLCPWKIYWADFYNLLHIYPSDDQMEEYDIFGLPAPSFAYNKHIRKKWIFLLFRICYFWLKIWNIHKVLNNLHISFIKIGQVVQELNQTKVNEYRKNA